MKTKIFEIPELIVFSIVDDNTIIDTIRSYYPNLKESDKNPEFYLDYESVQHFGEFAFVQNSEILRPFRNCIYYNSVDTNSEQVIAYAPQTNQTIEHGLIRENNNIKIFSEEINGKVFLRTIRELILRKHIEKGYFPLHASSTVFANKAILQFGPKRSGKSTALFKQTTVDKFLLMSNDITLVGQEKGSWNAITMPYDLTFDSSLFNEKKPQKVRFTPEEFGKKYGVQWCNKGVIGNISFLTLEKEKKYTEVLISKDNLLDKLINYGKDSHFSFDDYLCLNNIFPTFKYEELSSSFEAKHISGNVFEKKR